MNPFYIAASVLLSATAASATSELAKLGFCIGTKDNAGNCKYQPDYEADLEKLSTSTQNVRIYSVSDCNTLQYLGPALAVKNFTAILGVWPNDEDHYAREKAVLTTYLPQLSVKNIRAFTVGSEALYREDMTAQQLADRINDFKEFVKNINDVNGESYSSVPVGTADSWNILVDGGTAPAIEASDIILANAFSYWQGQEMNNATNSFFDDIQQAHAQVKKVKGDKKFEFWVGETGWPTEGGNFEAAVPSLENAVRFWKEGICGIRRKGIDTFVFEAFDEAWKPHTSNVEGVEQHWGVYDSEGKLKYDLDCGEEEN